MEAFEASGSRSIDARVIERVVPRIGRLQLRPLQHALDMSVVHAWVTQPHARYWGMVGLSIAEVSAAYAEIAQHSQVYLGFHDGEPAFLLECYDPYAGVLAEHYAVEAGDRGMHVLLARSDAPRSGFSWAVFTLVMDFLFSDAATSRVVVEPDIRNQKIHRLNRRAGFRYQKMIALPNKMAHLATCTREQYRAAMDAERAGQVDRPAPVETFRPEVWSAVNRALLRKAISEFAHERLITPQLQAADAGWDSYRLQANAIDYDFRARRLELEHWDIDASSLEKRCDGRSVPLDAIDFILEFREQLGIAPATLPVYLEEIASTLYAAAYRYAEQVSSAADLVHADFQEIEAAMAEGHPCFLANSGRVGFDAGDHLAHAPETAAAQRLLWLAAHKQRCEFSSAHDLSYSRLMHEELGSATLAHFDRTLRELGHDPSDYLLMPVHPWQWFNKLAFAFAPDIAARDLVCLGYGADVYRAQQSIRTFFNLSHPHKRYVKTALSILNMGFMRGLSADYMRATPAINDWIASLIDADSYFAEHGFGILREVAGIGYRNPHFEAAVPKSSPYRKMLAALWRESPVPLLQPGQRAMTMAALLHRDRDGIALLPQLMAASGIEIDRWLDRYLDCYLAPLVHCFYRYDLAFMPHGENVILVLQDNVPVRAFLKDIAEEAVVMDGAHVLPEAVQRLAVSVPAPLRTLSVFTDVFDDFLRYVSAILLEQADYPELRFWQRVAACVSSYRVSHPELGAKFDEYDLFAPEFPHSCLNRLQLNNNQQMVDLSDPTKALRFAGTLRNPIAGANAPEMSPDRKHTS